MRFKATLVVMTAVAMFSLIGVAAHGDAIQKWRTPNGSLYFGDRPPAGSTLLETIADSPSAVTSSAPSELERAAAEGRDIIRRREAARETERQRDAERDAFADQLEANVEPQYETPFWIIDTVPPCSPGDACFDDGGHHHGHHHHHDGWDRGPTQPQFPYRQFPAGAMRQPAPMRRGDASPWFNRPFGR